MRKISLLIALILVLFSCKKEKIIFDAVANEQFELSLILKLDGKDCVFDSEQKLLKYSIDEASLLNFSPTVEFQEISELALDGKVLKNKTINNLGSLKLNKLYPLTIKTNGEIHSFNLLFTNIPIIQIVAHDDIINEPKTLSKMIVHYPQKDRQPDINWIGIELRGATSLFFDKKSYGINIYADRSLKNQMIASFFDLNPNNKWILNGMFVDPSRLRNKVSFDLWNSMSGLGEHVHVESRFVEVYINQSAKGLYAFMEKFTEQLLQTNDESVLIEGTDNSLITKFIEYPITKPKNSYWEGWEQKFISSNKGINWIDFEKLSELIVKESSSEFKIKIGQRIDLNNVIDYYLFLNVCYATDNLGKNWFFFKRNSTDKFTIIPWDLDGSWGRNPIGDAQDYNLLVSNNLYSRLAAVNPDNYNQKLRQRWAELRSTVFSEASISSLINSHFTELGNYEIIPFENQIWKTNINLENERVYMNSWISSRLVFLDNYFQ